MTRRAAAALSALIVLVWSLAGCGPQEAAFQPPRLDLPFEHYSLANGLDVILREDHRVPLASVNIWYHVGPANENRNSTGFAHLFEHMMLQGSGHAPGDYFRRLQAIGATNVNGNTDLDRTSYLEDVPSNQLELALWLESDRMGFLLDALDEKTLANQQAVARNERRQKIENAPYGLAQEQLYRLLFPRGHPYRSSVLGSHRDIQSANLEDVRRFFKRFYVPNNAGLSIVGDIDIAATRRLVNKYFGSIPRGRDIAAPEFEPVQLDRERRISVTDRVELPRVYMAWHTPGAFRPGDAAATVTARLLGGGKAGRLFENLVYDRQIAQSASSRQRSLAHGSVFQIVATAKPQHSSRELEAAVQAELERLGRDGPGEKELRATKSALVAITIKSLEPFGGVADRLNAYNHFLGDPAYLNRDVKRYADVTADDVRDFVRQRLLTDRRVVVHVRPGRKVLPPEIPAAAAVSPPAAPPPLSKHQPWRNEVPAARNPLNPQVAVPESFRLDNGLTVFVAETGSLPLVTARLVALQGTSSDPPELPGLGDFASAMLNEGAGKRSAIGIADDLTALGSTLESGASRDGSWVNVQALKPQLRRSLSIMADVVLRPSFPAREIERLRDDRLTALIQQRSEPMTTALKLMWRELYGPGHPYAHGDLGTEESIRKTTRKDLLAAHQRVFTPDSSALIFAGDITPGRARELAAGLFGKWNGSAPRPPAPPAASPDPPRVLLVDKPGLPQSAVVLAQVGLPRSDPDFPKLSLINVPMGVLFSSRLNQSLRETHGYTYGVNSVVSQNRGPGPIRVTASVEADRTGDSIREALKEVGGIKQGGITQGELDEARQAILYSVTDLFDTGASTASTIADLFVLGLPADHFRGLSQRLAGMSTAELAAAARRHLRPDEMKVIVVGDEQRVGPQLKSLGLGPVEHRTPDGAAK